MDTLTALISCSPIKSHPSTEIIEECIESIKARTDARIIVMADGVREEQEDYRPRYEEFLTRLQKKYPDIEIANMDSHKHQARTTNIVLQIVKTPVILFIEHDMALYGDIPKEEMCKKILDGEADLIRLLYEDNDLINFKHLMKEKVGDYTKTMQWSSRPHFASSTYYRRILSSHFSPNSKTFIEDRMHGVIEAEDNWNNNKLWTYTPEVPVQRFTYRDGRGDDSKYDDQLIF